MLIFSHWASHKVKHSACNNNETGTHKELLKKSSKECLYARKCACTTSDAPIYIVNNNSNNKINSTCTGSSKTFASKPVARHFNLPNHSNRHMAVCSLSLHQGSTESRKTLEQKSTFQISTLNPNGINKCFSFN